MSNKNWDPNLTPEQNYVLSQEGTEAPGSSKLNEEKRCENEWRNSDFNEKFKKSKSYSMGCWGQIKSCW